jgi:cell division protein FtsL
VPFLNSLFCKQGADNRTRFFVIILTSYISFLILNALIHNTVFSLLCLALSAYSSATSTLRRLNDAKLKHNWLFASLGAYLSIGLATIFISSTSINWLILIPITMSALLLTYPSKVKQSYILGYNGPVDLSNYKTKHNSTRGNNTRIEPTFAGHSSQNNDFTQNGAHQANLTSDENLTSAEQHAFAAKQPSQTIIKNPIDNVDIGEKIRAKLVEHNKALFLILALFTFMVISISLFSISTNYDTKNTDSSLKSKVIYKSAEHLTRLNPLEMPDNFTLYLTQYNGLIIHWQADEPSKEQRWSIKTAQGDESCQSIRFNKGESFRILTVSVENSLDHFASFSPLDTHKLLQAIAFRGSFSLCDFKFSLKGSQTALGKNSHYADLIDY